MTSRRNFLKTMGSSLAGIALSRTSDLLAHPTIIASKEWSSIKHAKIRIAYIGIGNRGLQDIEEFAKTDMVDVVALCDVDLNGGQCQKALSMYPKAKRYRNFRNMFEEAHHSFDAVCVATPDFIHFPIAMMALAYGKHIYLEKPMTRTFFESELLMSMAKRHPELATQVGNQGHSEANYFQFKAWKEAGIIKDVTAITAHMNNIRRWHHFDVLPYRPRWSCLRRWQPTGSQFPDIPVGWMRLSGNLLPSFRRHSRSWRNNAWHQTSKNRHIPRSAVPDPSAAHRQY